MTNSSTPSILTQKAPTVLGSPSDTSGNTSYTTVINAAPVTMTITKYQFRQLFTLQEKIQIDNATLQTNLTQQQQMMLVTLEKDLNVADNIQLGTPDINNAIGFLTQIGILTPQRAMMVLANLPPTAV